MAKAGKGRNSWDNAVIKETIIHLQKKIYVTRMHCVYAVFCSISADFIFIETVFSFRYLELIMPRLAITWVVCTFVCARKTSCTFMHLRKAEWVAASKSHLARFIQMYRLRVLIYHEYCGIRGGRAKGGEIWCRKSEEKGKKEGAQNWKVLRCKVTA